MSDADDAFIRQSFDLIDGLDGLSDPLDVQKTIFDLVARCGFSYFAITRLPQPSDRLGPNLLLSVWPEGWLTHYDRVGHYRYDPVVRHCFRTTEPFSWNEAPLDPDTAPQARRVMEEAREHGMGAGYCVPIHDAHGFQGGISLAGERVEMTPRVRRAVHLLGLYAWSAAARTTSRRRKPGGRLLSARERDVLSCAAQGRTQEETADFLGVSVETVSTYLRNARTKIGTRNTTHTVIEALRLREITL
ncbi:MULTISPECIES: LuxR family transcriptional regulator [Methylobacterium]|jgi:LuxR family quorum sensing-dependent transcriptional regulator|uniref:DNA-binding HTH domain-containing proteins n=2 Tax=Methylobacterium TaxID=407 RepID=A0A1Y0ZIU5_9HYPH|nr:MULTISPECIES: LuxR family transcriptional regulator [Methylobacterium]MBK3395570.1 LuxR family transcriptional regulator [Methylobacterium ajmalii]MBK3408704.1 LuxR family transcriptional regulator [Methylobacterium ajmalii]MBK3425023.1 LuxR family transcriptional regulator [Methylobacterium ajmalii]MBZ6416749.1 LuxR family transcriptional regulator [Methylobacterium sp.]BAR47284.1 DNA-binding HTH domain-containing proteins [Methylobacterium aquaticum]